MNELKQEIQEEINRLRLQIEVGKEEGHFSGQYGSTTYDAIVSRLTAFTDMHGWIAARENRPVITT